MGKVGIGQKWGRVLKKKPFDKFLRINSGLKYKFQADFINIGPIVQ